MTNRRLLRLTGPDTAEFLQGLVTNDVRRVPIYTALLSPQGKYLADFFIIPDGDGFLLDVPADQADDLLRRLGDGACFGPLVAEELKRDKCGYGQCGKDEERHPSPTNAFRIAIDDRGGMCCAVGFAGRVDFISHWNLL